MSVSRGVYKNPYTFIYFCSSVEPRGGERPERRASYNWTGEMLTLKCLVFNDESKFSEEDIFGSFSFFLGCIYARTRWSTRSAGRLWLHETLTQNESLCLRNCTGCGTKSGNHPDVVKFFGLLPLGCNCLQLNTKYPNHNGSQDAERALCELNEKQTLSLDIEINLNEHLMIKCFQAFGEVY